jgi:hypothetical protein
MGLSFVGTSTWLRRSQISFNTFTQMRFRFPQSHKSLANKERPA